VEVTRLGTTRQLCVPVVEATQVGEARRAATKIAQDAGFSEVRSGEVAIVATELATNLSRYGQDGRLLVQSLTAGGGSFVELLAVDRGPGVADLQRCLRDGFSSGGTAGAGLGAVRRLSATFDIHSTPGAGTVVLSRVAGHEEAAFDAMFEWGAISTAALHEHVCGDAWRIVERDGAIAVMVADGLGHGPLAAEAALLAATAFEEHAFDDPAAFFAHAQSALTSSRGAAVAAGHILPSGAVRYAGIGNISGSIVSDTDSRGLVSHNGTVGLTGRKAQTLEYRCPDGAMLIMHSDGMSSRWSLTGSGDGLLARHPAIVAAVLHRDYKRGSDDATIVVIRYSQEREARR